MAVCIEGVEMTTYTLISYGWQWGQLVAEFEVNSFWAGYLGRKTETLTAEEFVRRFGIEPEREPKPP